MDKIFQESQLHFGDCILDKDRLALFRDGVWLTLRPQSFKVLVQLIQNQGRTVSKDRLLKAGWGEHHDHNIVHQAVRNLRTVLGDQSAPHRFIQTVPGKGYCFVAAVYSRTASEGAAVVSIRQRGPSTDRSAISEYLARGRMFWAKRSPPDLLKAIECFTQALSRDPESASACAGLSESYLFLALSGYPTIKVMPDAELWASRALELDPFSPSAHAALGAVKCSFHWDWAGAEVHFVRAMGLDPTYVNTYCWRAMALACLGRTSEAIEAAEKAHELDPASPITNAHVGKILYLARRYDRSREELMKCLELDPHCYHALWPLGLVYIALGRFREAIGLFQQALTLSGRDPHVLAMLGQSYALCGNTNRAQEILSELLLRRDSEHVPMIYPSMIYAALGEIEECFAGLDQAYIERALFLSWLKVWPGFDTIRADPRYLHHLQRINLSPESYHRAPERQQSKRA
jgi:DNA-binding winged helix-turn-helix (wHTH) protein/tetratricopeptide (TPR) repeat protein